MKGSIVWKLVFTVFVLGWALLNLVPLQDTPFEDFIEVRATSNVEEFDLLLDRARERVEAGTDPTLYIALRELALEERIDLYNTYFPDINLIDVRNLEKRNRILMEVLLKESQGKLKRGLDLEGGVAFTYRVQPDESAENRDAADIQTDKVVEILSERINGLGVAEPLIRAVPPDGIEVQLPGLNLVDNPEAREAINKPARLEFRLVHRYSTPSPDQTAGSIVTLPENPRRPDSPTAAYEVLVMEREDDEGNMQEIPMFVKRIPEATGRIIDTASPTLDPAGRWAISFNMTSEGAKRFGEITQAIYDGDRETGTRQEFAIVLDGKLESAPGVNEPITTGRGQISGDFSQREAFELANVLNNPLESKLIEDEVYVVGPTLAEDAREASINAAIWGAGAVIIFMILYYGLAGIVAVLSVVLNLLIVLGILASVGATLTLPGVAALVLTIGMAVDANILIYERIREEFKTGKTSHNALNAGYGKALSTIVDANVTTMIIALILFSFGREAVKGFGLTLAIGIGSSVFAALIISRALLEIVVSMGAKKLLPFTLLKPTHMQFLKFRWPAFATSWVIVLIGVFAMATHWDTMLGTDFRGGAEVKLEFNQAAKDQLSISNILDVAERENLGEIQPVFQQLLGDNKERLSIQMDGEQGRVETVVAALQTAFPGAELVKVESNVIGASVSEAVQKNAILSVIIALGAILIYVAMRFDIGYGVGAVVATVHDVLMSIGIYVILGQILDIGSGQFSGPMVAAILMIVGYSINDTIVVFDRIREELELNPDMKLYGVVDLAINRTLSRTLLTSITTLAAATALFVFGEGIVTDFALVFIIGILTGTFSSVFIASPVFYAWHKGNRKSVTEGETKRPEYEWESNTQRTRRAQAEAKS